MERRVNKLIAKFRAFLRIRRGESRIFDKIRF